MFNYSVKTILKRPLFIALACSLGVVASFNSMNVQAQNQSVDAGTLQKNLELTKQKNNFSSLTIISSAISYTSSDFINFSIDKNNLGSKVAPIGEKVATLTLHSLLNSYQHKPIVKVCI